MEHIIYKLHKFDAIILNIFNKKMYKYLTSMGFTDK